MAHRLEQITVRFEDEVEVIVDCEGDVTFPERFMDKPAVSFILKLMKHAKNYNEQE